MNTVFLMLILSWPFNSPAPRMEFETREQCVEVKRDISNFANLNGFSRDRFKAFCVKVQK